MISVSDFAKEVGRDKALISRLVKRGVIPRNADGTIPYQEGLAAFHAYNNAPKNKGGRGKKNPPIVQPEKPVKQDISEQEESKIEQPDLFGKSGSVNAAMNKAKLANLTFQAKNKELDFKFKAGELLDKHIVLKAIETAVANYQATMRSIPSRISSMCEGRTSREIEEIISDEIEKSFEVLKKLQDEYSAE